MFVLHKMRVYVIVMGRISNTSLPLSLFFQDQLHFSELEIKSLCYFVTLYISKLQKFARLEIYNSLLIILLHQY